MSDVSTINYLPLKDMDHALANGVKIVLTGWRLAAFSAVLVGSLALLLVGRYEFIIVLPVLFMVAVAYYAQKIKTNAWLMFAAVNNWGFDNLNNPGDIIPPSLHFGYDPTLSPVIQANIGGIVCDLVSYTCTTGEDKSAQKHNFTVAAMTMPLQMPHVLLLCKKNPSGMRRDLGDGEELQLEGDFRNYFSLQIERDKQVDVLKLITPDVMQALVDYGQTEDIEMIGTDLYFITKSDIRNFDDMPGLINSVNAVAGELIENHSLSHV